MPYFTFVLVKSIANDIELYEFFLINCTRGQHTGNPQFSEEEQRAYDLYQAQNSAAGRSILRISNSMTTTTTTRDDTGNVGR